MSRLFLIFIIFNLSQASSTSLQEAINFLKDVKHGKYKNGGIPRGIKLQEIKIVLRENAKSIDVLNALKSTYSVIKNNRFINNLGLHYIVYLSGDKDLIIQMHQYVKEKINQNIENVKEEGPQKEMLKGNATRTFNEFVLQQLIHSNRNKDFKSIGKFAASLPISYSLLKDNLEGPLNRMYSNVYLQIYEETIKNKMGPSYLNKVYEEVKEKKINLIQKAMSVFIPAENITLEENQENDDLYRHNGYYQVNNFISALLKFNDDELTQDLLDKNLEDYVDKIKSCNTCQSFLVLAYMSPDQSLKQLAIEKIKDRISGKDLDFYKRAEHLKMPYSSNFYEYREEYWERQNVTQEDSFQIKQYDFDFNSEKGRATYLVEMFADMYSKLRPFDLQEKYLDGAVNLLKEVISDYDLISERVEYLWYEKIQGREEFAKKIMAVFKGEGYSDKLVHLKNEKIIMDTVSYLKELPKKIEIRDPTEFLKMKRVRWFMKQGNVDPRIDDAIFEAYPTIHDKVENYNNIFPVYLYLHSKDSHKKKIEDLMRKRLKGEDALFKKRYHRGGNALNYKERFRSFFIALEGMLPRNNNGLVDLKYIKSAAILLTQHDYSYKDLKDIIEGLYYEDFNLRSDLALELIKMMTDEKYVLEVMKLRKEKKIKRDRDRKYGKYISIMNQTITDAKGDKRKNFLQDFINNSNNIAKLITVSKGDQYISELVIKKLKETSLFPDYYKFRLLWLAAENSDNPAVMLEAKYMMKQRINGFDEKFNNSIGINLKTKKDRANFYFDELMSAVLLNDESKRHFNLASEIIQSWDYEYDFFKEKVESWARNSIGVDPRVKGFVRQFIIDKKGEDYYNKVVSQNINNSKKFIMVNGGYRPTANSENQEDMLLTFHHKFFNSEAILLNGGGVNSYIQEIDHRMSSVRDKDGFAKIIKSKVKIPTLEASTKNLKDVFSELASKKETEKLTFIYADHGGKGGVAFWDGENMDAVDFKNEHEKFSESTMIQSVYMACYSGANVVDINRRIPHTTKHLSNFLKFHYKKNRCALAKTSHDELGFAIDSKRNWRENNFTNFLNKYPKPTLENLKEFFYDNNVKSTPMLTSDYFLEDIATTICNEHIEAVKENPSYNFTERIACEYQYPSIYESFENSTRDIWKNIVDNYCTKNELKEAQKVKLALDETLNFHYDKYLSLVRLWQIELIKDKYPEVYEEYINHKNKIEAIEKKYADNLMNPLAEEDREKLKKLKKNYPETYLRMLVEEHLFHKHKEYFNNKLNSILNSNEEYITIKKHGKVGVEIVHASRPKRNMNEEEQDIIQIPVSKIKKLIRSEKHRDSSDLGKKVEMNFRYEFIRLQQARINIMKKLKVKRREIIEKFIDEPNLKDIKEVYDSIVKCENTPFN